MPSDLSGAELDAKFFEVCCGWTNCGCWSADESDTGTWVGCPPEFLFNNTTIFEPLRVGGSAVGREPIEMFGYGTIAFVPKVSTDASDCEAWAMRWAREQGLRPSMEEMSSGGWCASLMQFDGDGEFVNSHDGQGSDWKEAFVRACVAAGQQLPKQSKGE